MIYGVENLLNKAVWFHKNKRAEPGIAARSEPTFGRIILLQETTDGLMALVRCFSDRMLVAINTDGLYFAEESDSKISFQEKYGQRVAVHLDEEDRLHRIDGPAVEDRYSQEYYLHGVKFSSMEDLFEATKDEDAMEAIYALGENKK